MTKTYTFGSVLRALIASYIVTGLALLGLAYAMYKFGLSERAVQFGISFIYIFSAAVGGLIVGKSIKQKKFLWGFVVGLLYVAIIFVASYITAKDGNVITARGMSTFLLCVGGGTLGGMIS